MDCVWIWRYWGGTAMSFFYCDNSSKKSGFMKRDIALMNVNTQNN